MQIGFWGWLLFNAFILGMLALDLGVFHRRAHEVHVREALRWTVVWFLLALTFNGWIYFRAGTETALQFFTGYVIEKTLSIDNIFVMVMIFSFFGVPLKYQHKVLFWGVLGALVMRGTFIGIGTYALHHWHAVMYLFGALLVVTGVRMIFKQEDQPDMNKNVILRLARQLLPVSHHFEGKHFFVRQRGRLLATPLFIVLLLIEVSDLIFAVDSIPAIFAITDDTFIVYTSNVFAILGLRSLYFVLRDIVTRFTYLKYGLGVVLVFIGVKMLIADIYEVPTLISLLVLTVVFGITIVVSSKFPPPEPAVQPVPAPEVEVVEV